MLNIACLLSGKSSAHDCYPTDKPSVSAVLFGCHGINLLKNLVSRELLRILENFHFSISISKHFDFTFHFSKKSESILISLCTSRKRVKAFFFTLHFSNFKNPLSLVPGATVAQAYLEHWAVDPFIKSQRIKFRCFTATCSSMPWARAWAEPLPWTSPFPTFWRTDMKEGDLLLQAGLGGSLHLSPGKFKGCNFYLRTIPMLLVRWRQLCHCTRPLDSS